MQPDATTANECAAWEFSVGAACHALDRAPCANGHQPPIVIHVVIPWKVSIGYLPSTYLYLVTLNKPPYYFTILHMYTDL